jgi:hypothetical protein
MFAVQNLAGNLCQLSSRQFLCPTFVFDALEERGISMRYGCVALNSTAPFNTSLFRCLAQASRNLMALGMLLGSSAFGFGQAPQLPSVNDINQTPMPGPATIISISSMKPSIFQTGR